MVLEASAIAALAASAKLVGDVPTSSTILYVPAILFSWILRRSHCGAFLDCSKIGYEQSAVCYGSFSSNKANTGCESARLASREYERRHTRVDCIRIPAVRRVD